MKERLIVYAHLMRLHKPIGILLLWFPTAWALWIANTGHPAPNLLFYFLAGSFLMRSAGCIINDIADRNIDLHVARTKNRPLTSGKINIFESLVVLLILLVLSFMILIQLPKICFYYAIVALLITFVYPFCKRFIKTPQFVLGLAFSMGIPMAFAASRQQSYGTMLILFLLNFFWILSYDTIYAMADQEDDIRIGVNSTAIFFGKYVADIIFLLQILMHLLWLLIAYNLHLSSFFYVCWLLAGFVIFYQQNLIRHSNKILTAFNSNAIYGFIMWLALLDF